MESTSSDIYNPKRFEAFWKPIIRVFQLLCLSHYSVFRSNLKSKHFQKWAFPIYYFIFDAFHVWIVFYITKIGLHLKVYPNNSIKESPLMFYVHCMSVFGNFITHLTAHIETLFKRKYEIEILEKFNEINAIFSTNLHHVIDFKILRRKYLLETLVIFIVSGTMSAISLFISDYDNTVRFLLIYGIIVIRARGCQISFSLNYLADCLLDLQVLLKRQQNKCGRKTVLYPFENIRYFRDIYSNCWLIKNLISDCYGWSMISFLVQCALTMINLAYWSYINMKFYESIELSVSK